MSHPLVFDTTVPELVDVDQTQRQALDLAAHDLLNRLTSILGVSGLLRVQLLNNERSISPAVMLERVELISTLARRMVTEVDVLLDVAQPASKRLGVRQWRPVDLVALARRIAGEQQAATERHHIQVTSAESALIAMCDEWGITSVLTNLLNNAIKYSPDGGPVMIALERLPSKEGGWIQVRVTDAGIGIPQAEQDQVFRRFYRASNAAGTIPGTGLGLAGVRHIIEQHGGVVLLESVEGEGTSVTLKVPLLTLPAS
jgi:signal transduction histidine kinase